MSIRAAKRSTADRSSGARCRLRIRVRGTVQGVGFRPFVYRLATQHGFGGFVCNDERGVLIEIEGVPDRIEVFKETLIASPPTQASIASCDMEPIAPLYEPEFVIRPTQRTGRIEARITPDIAVCDDCLRELSDPNNRRFAYPFINCTNCGPRFTIVEKIPYDRPYTSMRVFDMCPACAVEYKTPHDRRFHAQPNSCPDCGPRLWLSDHANNIAGDDPIAGAIRELERGMIVAVKGIGGFHLAVDATNDPAVARLRQRKHREDKPLAVMMPNLATVRRFCSLSDTEADILTGPRRPIVLLQKRADNPPLAESISPDTNLLGVMLPYTPVHYLLFRSNLQALVMTSGNFSEEPIAIGNEEAVVRLSEVADVFLMHDREIVQRCDDSIVRVIGEKRRIMRRSRGYVPKPIQLPYQLSRPLLACGADLKNTFALGSGSEVMLSQHIGDLDNIAAFDAFSDTVEHFRSLFQIQPTAVACDMHPGYRSTIWAHTQNDVPVIPVQHHHAHLASVMAENGRSDKTIGIILDGTGFGTDETIWGGEILIGDFRAFERCAWLAPVPMPGGDMAARQPWRMAVSYLLCAGVALDKIAELAHRWGLESNQLEAVVHMLDRRFNAPLTSGCGRLFDAVSAILGLCTANTYEGKAAMMLEAAAGNLPLDECEVAYPVENDAQGGPISCKRLIHDAFEGALAETDKCALARRFHIGLAEKLISVARLATESTSIRQIGLSGGVFQNRLLLEYMTRRLAGEGISVLTHEQVPTNDGGIALGQIVIANSVLTAKGSA